MFCFINLQMALTKLCTPTKNYHNNPDIIGQVIWGAFRKTELIDAAIAKINNSIPIDFKRSTRCTDLRFSGIAPPELFQEIEKCGRSTGLTRGVIKSINCTVVLNNGNDTYRNQILMDIKTNDGDSGSVIYTKVN